MATYNTDTYNGPAAIHSRDGLLGAVHADVTWQGETWSGVLVVTREAMNWMNKDLTLHIDGHPAAEIGITSWDDPTATAAGGQVRATFQGRRRAPFWAARPREELVQELRKRRRPMAGASGPGGEPSAWNIDVDREIRAVLKDRDGMTDAQINEAIESPSDNDT